MTKLGYLALALMLTAAACSDKDTPDMDPAPPAETANGVFPSSGLIGRELTVEISGNNTNWSASTTVSFGTSVQVKSVMVASPTDLYADIVIDPTAAPSVNDVVVTDGSNMYTLAKAFTLSPAILVKMQGTAAQGSIGFFTIQNKDFDNPFDTTSTGDGLFTPIVYTNLALTGPTGTDFEIQSATEYTITGQVTFDTDAGTGPVMLVSGPQGGTTITSTDTTFSVATRTGTALASGTAASYMVMNPDDSALYQYTATNPTLLTLDVEGNGQTSSPTQVILPNSGNWADVSNGTNFTANYAIIPAGQSVYPVVIDVSGSTGFSVSTTPTAVTMNHADDTDPGNDAKTGAQAATLPFMLTTGKIASMTDQDWIKFTATAADVGKSIHVLTAGDPLTDVSVDIQNALGTSVVTDPNTGATGPIDDYYQEDAVSDPIAAAGVYYIEIQAGGLFDAGHNTYIAGIWLE